MKESIPSEIGLLEEFSKLPDAPEEKREWQRRILNTKLSIKGLSVPDMIALAKRHKKETILRKDVEGSYELTFVYFLASFMKAKDFAECLSFLKENIDLVDSWSIVDTSVRYVKGLDFDACKTLIKEKETFIRRFGYVGLLKYSKDNALTKPIFDLLDDDDRYYVMMAEAWLLSYLLIEDFETTYRLMKSSKLNPDMLLKGIQKAVDSYRVSKENKERLRELRKEIRSMTK